MAELDKINVNGELYDMSDSKARSDIALEVTNRTNADKALDDKVKAETEARTSADNALNQKIVQETTNRTNADNALQTAVNAEAQAREQADNTLQGKINTNKNDISELKGDLAANTSNITKNASNITKNANDIKTLQEDLSSVGQQADDNKKEIANLTTSVNEKFLASGLGILRTGKLYGTKVWKSASNLSTNLEKTRDNIGLVCQPSTDTVLGRDDYADIPLFQWVKCNYKRYDDGFAYPVAIEGDGNYKETGDVDCGAMQPTFWYKEIDNDSYKELIISDSPNHALMLEPWEEAVRADGTVMPYFIQSRYHSVTGSDGLFHSILGKPANFQSYNNIISNYPKKGTGYKGAGSNRYTFAQIFCMIKYAKKSIQDVMAGCTNYNLQYKASIQYSELHNYFPVTNAQAANFVVGSSVDVGYGSMNGTSVNIDRGVSTMHTYASMAKITKIETLDSSNKAIYVDCEPFATTPVTVGENQMEIYISTMHWHSGSTDCVLGHHDGSPNSNTNGKNPCRIQGIEFMVGGYDVASDTVMIFQSDYSKDVYIAPRGVARSNSEATIKSTYTKIGNIPGNNGSDFWIGDVTHVKGGWYPSSVVSAESYGMRDRCYAGGQATSGLREYLQGGYLWHGSYAGLSYLSCRNWLTGALWSCLSAD